GARHSRAARGPPPGRPGAPPGAPWPAGPPCERPTDGGGKGPRDPNKRPRRSQEALAAAQRLASDRNHQVIEPEHLLHALLSQSDGVVFGVVQRLGAVPGTLRDRVDELLGRIPKVYGGTDQGRIGSALSRVLDQAFREAEGLKDEYVSTEHLLLALVEVSSGGRLHSLFDEFGITRDKVLAALVEIRGTQRVTSADPEGTYQALERFGREIGRASCRERGESAEGAGSV